MKTQSRLTGVRNLGKRKPFQATVAALIAATVGTIFVLAGHAATPTASVEPENGTVSSAASALADISASGGHAVRFGSTSSSAGPIRATFYYPWFPETWGSLSAPFTNYHPENGYYSSDDATIVTKHIDEMTYAGMDAAIASWWGAGQHSESTRIPALLNNSANNSNGKNLQWSLYYEQESTGDPTAAQITSDLSYIKTNYTSNAHYLKINNKPVIFVYTDGADACPMADRWAQANASEGFYVVLKVFSGYTTCASQPFGWHQYGPGVATDQQGTYSYSISPGYYKKGDATPLLPRLDATTWGSNIDKMVASNAKFQLVTTFNEWGEGTAVEPATEWSSASGYGTYIDVLHQKLGISSTDTTAPAVPANVKATGSSQGSAPIVSLSWSASTDTGGSGGLAGYQIFKNGTLLTTVTTVSYTDTAVQFGTQYSYLVKAIDNAGNVSAASSTVTATPVLSGCSQAPSAPANFTAVLQSSTSNVVSTTWSAVTEPSGCSITGYNIYRTGTKVATVGATTLAYSDSTTTFNTTYTYSVTATDNSTSASESAQSTTKQVTTPTQTDTAAPNVPTNVAAMVQSATQVAVSWSAVTDNPATGAAGVAGYQVFRNGTSIGTTGAGSTSLNDSFAFVQGQSYSYTVRAFDAASPANYSAQSAASSGVIPNPVVITGAPCSVTSTKPTYNHIIWIWGENSGYSALSNMPYLNGLANACATDPNYMDNMFGSNDQVSEPHYIAGTGGSNCNTGLTPLTGSTGCRTGDTDPPTSGVVNISSIFQQINNKTGKSWKAYQEGMSSNCAATSGGSSYATKHNPPPFFSNLIADGSCAKYDVPFPAISCSSSSCPAAPNSILTQDIDNGTLPSFSFITPNLCNDMHDCSAATMDQWLKVYLARILSGPNYMNGDTAVFVLWDESSPNTAQPNVFIAPSISPNKPTTTINTFAVLRATEQMLGLPSLDGCAGGTTPGNIGACPTGSTVDIRTLFNF